MGCKAHPDAEDVYRDRWRCAADGCRRVALGNRRPRTGTYISFSPEEIRSLTTALERLMRSDGSAPSPAEMKRIAVVAEKVESARKGDATTATSDG